MSGPELTISKGLLSVNIILRNEKIDEIKLSQRFEGDWNTDVKVPEKSYGMNKVILDWFNDYLSGNKPTGLNSFGKEILPLNMGRLSIFQKRVFEALLKVPYGKVISYEELALMSGGYNYRRAVALALSRNPFPIIIPCHRIVYKKFFTVHDKQKFIGGFGCGIEIKNILLKLENPKIFPSLLIFLLIFLE